jgi:hypothetical protein
MQKYLRLLSYENASKVIDFINKNDSDDYANITAGGFSVNAKEDNWETIENFIKSLSDRYEITLEHPDRVHQKIVNTLKGFGIVE